MAAPLNDRRARVPVGGRVVDEVPSGAKLPFAWEHVVDSPTVDVHSTHLTATLRATLCP